MSGVTALLQADAVDAGAVRTKPVLIGPSPCLAHGIGDVGSVTASRHRSVEQDGVDPLHHRWRWLPATQLKRQGCDTGVCGHLLLLQARYEIRIVMVTTPAPIPA